MIDCQIGKYHIMYADKQMWAYGPTRQEIRIWYRSTNIVNETLSNWEDFSNHYPTVRIGEESLKRTILRLMAKGHIRIGA